MEKIRIAQWGTKHGHASGKWRALVTNSQVEPVGIYEPDTQRRRDVEGKGPYEGAHFFDDPAEFMQDKSIVAVASEGGNHESLDQTLAIVEGGKHVWYDKPAGDDWAKWQQVISLARQQKLQVQMGFMLRYSDAFKQVDEWVKSGLLGQVFSLRAHMSTRITDEMKKTISQHNGGIFFDLAAHMLDQVVWLLGRPQKVTSFLRNDATPEIPAFADNGLGVFEFEQAMAFVDIAAMEARPMQRRFEVYGTQGSAVIVEPFEPGQRLRLVLDEAAGGYQAGEQEIELPGQGRQRLYELELESFLAVIGGAQEPDRPYEHELLVQETLLRATGYIGE
jgi:predicted dehydrogenase